MHTEILLALSLLLLIGYIFDILSPKLKIPYSIWLFLFGFLLKILALKTGFEIPEIKNYLIPLGTIALILIVLEAALELELKKEKKVLLFKSFFVALISIVSLSFAIAYLLPYFSSEKLPFKILLINALPLAVISSAVAIPASKFLEEKNKEFVIYESSLSDILGIILFNILLLVPQFNIFTILSTFFSVGLVILISILITIFLAWIIGTIYHDVKFIPILLVLIFLYTLSKYLHLSRLIIIFIFGLTLRNILDLKIFQRFHPEVIKGELCNFDFIVKEFTFLAKSLFFLLFGFFVDPPLLLNLEVILFSIFICGLIFLFRGIILFIFRNLSFSLLLIAPRGLITILLWISIPQEIRHPLINEAVIVFLISFTMIFMILGILKGHPERVALQKGPVCKL